LLGTASVSDDHDFWGFTDYGVNAMAKFTPNPAFELYGGYDYQNYNGNDVVLVIDKKTEHTHAVFGEIATTRALLPNAQFAAGFRYNAPSAGKNSTVWNVTGRWDILDSLFVKGMVGTAFRLPTAEEAFANDPNDERGNPNLKPEKSTNVNASIGGFIGSPSIRWEVIGFYRDVTDLIEFGATFDPNTNQDVFGNVPGTVRVRGANFVLDADFTDEFSGNLSYQVSSSKNSLTDLQLNRVPEQIGKVLFDYHPMAKPFGLFASLNYVGKIHDTLGGTRVDFGKYAVVDVGGRWFLDPDRHHRLDFNIINLFDKEYATRLTRGFPDDGSAAYQVWNLGLPRTLRVAYSYSFF
jgi:vitamin B12 transporter